LFSEPIISQLPISMTPIRLPLLAFISILFSLFNSGCTLISETGPLKGEINSHTDSYRLVDVASGADIPKRKLVYGQGKIPTLIKGPAYSDRIRERDSLHFVITDLSEQSPFNGLGAFGPVEVPGNGLVEIPYVGAINVNGKLLSEISEELNEKIKPVSNTARASVTRSGRLPLVANVIGKVKNPGPVPLERAGITSVDLLSAAGGPTDSEHLFIYHFRRNGSNYDLDYLAFRDNPFLIEEGDLLSVATDNTKRFHVMGAINRPVSVAFPLPNPTLADALGAATGFDERRSDPSGVFIFREGNPATVYTFNLKKPQIMQLIQRFPIEGNDIVYVTEAPLSRWNRLVSQILPSVNQAAGSAFRFNNF